MILHSFFPLKSKDKYHFNLVLFHSAKNSIISFFLFYLQSTNTLLTNEKWRKGVKDPWNHCFVTYILPLPETKVFLVTKKITEISEGDSNPFWKYLRPESRFDTIKISGHLSSKLYELMTVKQSNHFHLRESGVWKQFGQYCVEVNQRERNNHESCRPGKITNCYLLTSQLLFLLLFSCLLSPPLPSKMSKKI